MTSTINYEEKANSYLKKAEEENNNKFARKSNVAVYYSKAATFFKMAKMWVRAGNAYKCAAECLLKGDDIYQAATEFIHAGESYKKDDNSLDHAKSMYAQGIKYFIDLTKLTMAARYEGDLGDLLAEKKDITNAIAAYQRAKELHEAENQPALAKQYQSKIDLLRLQS